MTSLLFSLVLYKHKLADVRPFFISLAALQSSSSDLFISLCIYDASPSGVDPHISSFLDELSDNISIDFFAGPNIGFGSANNHNFRRGIQYTFEYFVIANPDIYFSPSDILPLFSYLPSIESLACAAPLVVDSRDNIQYSAKNNPSLLSLFLGRFSFFRNIPTLNSYFLSHINFHLDYRSNQFSSPYLSGCFLVVPKQMFHAVGGFDERYFLHLEDADLVRSLSLLGQTLHCPVGKVVHLWARGSHSSLSQSLSLLSSMFKYFSKWGLILS